VLDPAGLLGALKRLRYARSSGRAEALFRVAFAAVLLIQLLCLRKNVRLGALGRRAAAHCQLVIERCCFSRFVERDG
jgi:hypothetical protein